MTVTHISELKMPSKSTRGQSVAASAFSSLGAALTERVRGSDVVPSTTAHEVDYVVIGAGSAGCVVANRLSQTKDVSVLLIEAGGPAEDAALRKFPAVFTEFFGSRFDWKYQTEQQKHLHDRIINWPRGKVFGGTSAINAMIYIRGHRLDYDRWAEQLGDPRWSFDRVLPFFKKSENNRNDKLVSSRFHSSTGELSVESTTKNSQLEQAVLDSLKSKRVTVNPEWDFNGKQQEDAAGFYQFTVKDGKRHSSASAFLTPVLNSRKNLKAKPWSLATRLLWENRRVAGVEYVSNDWEIQAVRARREVIVCAGAVDSPQLLMLSGIGPAEELRRHGISVRADLPGVGANLQDHLMVPVTLNSRLKLDPDWTGFGGLFFRSALAAANDSPDLQFYFADIVNKQKIRNVAETTSGLFLAASFGTPYSRGQIALRSPNPLSKPVIQPNYLSDDRDLKILVEGLEFVREVASSKEVVRVTDGEAIHPEAKIKYLTDDQVKVVRQYATTIWHPAGTCKMGVDDLSVVDSQLRVRGVDGLRVADASIMPILVNGNTNAPCIMIGEMVSSMIRQHA